MNLVQRLQDALVAVYDLGGPVVAVLLATSVVTASLVLYKIWQFRAAGVGRHKVLAQAVDAWDLGDRARAAMLIDQSRSYLAPVIRQACGDPESFRAERADAEAEDRFARLERGLSALDIISQLAPLLGLFGTVLGMIDAFRALQNAGTSVDPSLLAGGIWVALLTTAAGLAVAMPTSLILNWFEARMRRDRVFANRALRVVFAPEAGTPEGTARLRAHGT
ncbi:MotA/TolQ/ExbB proton channel family protein [Marinibacterium sp. SX1]|uniref:MotA/TolQ/ExbB proton channel family protein n=1 Tax=Marinibacterium sp. SX1 TaxID=3388424 RepID=UPI003D17394D